MAQDDKTKSKEEAFVKTVIERLKGPDTSFGALLRRADNPATEYQSWEYLCRWCDIEKSWKYKPYALVGAALARAKPQTNGHLGIGRAIAQCYSDEGKSNGNEQPAARAAVRTRVHRSRRVVFVGFITLYTPFFICYGVRLTAMQTFQASTAEGIASLF